MLYDHNDPAFIIRYARTLIDKAREAEDIGLRHTLLTEASHAITAAERMVKGGKPVVILAEVA
jgi:hypothetical protein